MGKYIQTPNGDHVYGCRKTRGLNGGPYACNSYCTSTGVHFGAAYERVVE